MKKKQKIFNFQPLTFVTVSHTFKHKMSPLQKEQLHSQEEYTQNAWSKYFSKLKSVSENILCCEAQQLGDYLSNEHTKE